MATNEDLVRRFYPESNIAGFSHVDATVAFFTQIAAVLKASDHVLDFGAGRGEPILDDQVAYRRDLSNLQGRCADLAGCDVDEVVLENPYLDSAKLIYPGRPLPYADKTFDLIVTRWVFEHISDPQHVAAELLRVLKPGGVIAAMTPNKWGYFALGARLVPNRLHAPSLTVVQPGRKAEDVFPTCYLMNTPSALEDVFGSSAGVFVSRWASEPGYHSGRASIYRLVRWFNKHLPAALQPILLVYIRKN